MNEKTNEDINRIITEKLFPELCWHETIVKDSGYPGAVECSKCGASVLRRKFCGWELPDFCNSDADIREARERIAEKGLQKEFRNALILEVGLYESHKWDYLKSQEIVDFDLIHSKPIFQARAICRVLEGLE